MINLTTPKLLNEKKITKVPIPNTGISPGQGPTAAWAEVASRRFKPKVKIPGEIAEDFPEYKITNEDSNDKKDENEN